MVPCYFSHFISNIDGKGGDWDRCLHHGRPQGPTQHPHRHPRHYGYAVADHGSLLHIPNIHKVSGDSGSSGHCGTDQVGAPTTSLAALEVAVAGRGTALALGKLIAVHGNTHAAS